jgi:hypothetical protein
VLPWSFGYSIRVGRLSFFVLNAKTAKVGKGRKVKKSVIEFIDNSMNSFFELYGAKIDHKSQSFVGLSQVGETLRVINRVISFQGLRFNNYEILNKDINHESLF